MPATPTPSDRPRAREDVTFQRLPDGSGVLVDLATGSTYALNATGAEAWALCDGRHTVDDIASAFLDRYEATPETVYESLAALLAHLAELGVLEQPG